MENKAAPVTFHEAQSVWHAVEAMGKKELARRTRAIAFQIYSYEQLTRHAVKLLRELGVSEELIRPFAAVVERTEQQ